MDWRIVNGGLLGVVSFSSA